MYFKRRVVNDLTYSILWTTIFDIMRPHTCPGGFQESILTNWYLSKFSAPRSIFLKGHWGDESRCTYWQVLCMYYILTHKIPSITHILIESLKRLQINHRIVQVHNSCGKKIQKKEYKLPFKPAVKRCLTILSNSDRLQNSVLTSMHPLTPLPRLCLRNFNRGKV